MRRRTDTCGTKERNLNTGTFFRSIPDGKIHFHDTG